MNPLPFELLRLARRLLGRGAKAPDQASLRRAISTAYYALFHLLTFEAGGIFVSQLETIESTVQLDTIKSMVRSYDHNLMLKASKSFANGKLPIKLDPLGNTLADRKRQPIMDRLKSVAKTFVDLQEARHLADYDLAQHYDRQAARRFVELAEAAFADWDQVREDDLARIYLACLLLFDAWNKGR